MGIGSPQDANANQNEEVVGVHYCIQYPNLILGQHKRHCLDDINRQPGNRKGGNDTQEEKKGVGNKKFLLSSDHHFQLLPYSSNNQRGNDQTLQHHMPLQFGCLVHVS